MKKILTLIFVLILSVSISEISYGQNKSRTKQSRSKTKTTTVKSYTKRDGTRVRSKKTTKISKRRAALINPVIKNEPLALFIRRPEGINEAMEP